MVGATGSQQLLQRCCERKKVGVARGPAPILGAASCLAGKGQESRHFIESREGVNDGIGILYGGAPPVQIR